MLPQDEAILVSYVNMKLRDQYATLEAFCEDTGEDMDALKERLGSFGYRYDASSNRFLPSS